MKLGTIVLAKYFNGVAPTDESEKYQKNLIGNFSEAGMFAFGQMPFIAKGPDPQKDYDWRNTDALVNFGQTNKIEILYNTVINSHDNSFPDWYKQLSAHEKVSALKRHVKAVISRYKGQIKVFKLVNEAFRYPEPNFFGTGEDRSKLIADIFHWAKEEYSEGVFMLNDHIPLLKEDELRPQYLDLIRKVLALGAPVDVIGIEGHLGYRPKPFQLPPDEFIHLALDEIHEASQLPVHVTEFDLSYDNGRTKPYPGSQIDPNLPFVSDAGDFPSWFAYQDYAYKHFKEICEQKRYVSDLVFWGFYDKDYTVALERPGIGFFDANFNPKPNLASLK